MYQDFVERTAGTAPICITLAASPLNPDTLQPYMNRIIRSRYQLNSIPFFYPKDGDIIFLLNVGKFLRYFFILYSGAGRRDFCTKSCPIRFKGPVSFPFV